MISIVIIGYGNVAKHLIDAFYKATTVNLIQVFARDLTKINHLKDKTKITNNFKTLKKADVYIISVSDDAIESVSSHIKSEESLVVHTSGSASINVLKSESYKGIFYPLQSFSKDKPINFNEIPFCLEATNDKDYNLLESLALAIGKKTYTINSDQRQKLHVAAVFVNNFTNHMYTIGHELCEKHQVPFEVLHPLIKETASKITSLSPKKAQTGPAIRNDVKTIENHLSLLNEEQQVIYKLLTKSIQNG